MCAEFGGEGGFLIETMEGIDRRFQFLSFGWGDRRREDPLLKKVSSHPRRLRELCDALWRGLVSADTRECWRRKAFEAEGWSEWFFV